MSTAGCHCRRITDDGVESIHPVSALPEISAKFAAIARGELFVAEDVPLLRKDGGLRQVDISGSAVVINGRLCNVGVFHDITGRKLAEQASRASELRLKEAQRIAKVGNWELDLPNGRLLWSDEVFHIFGVDQNLFAPSYEAFLNAIHPDDRDAVDKATTIRWLCIRLMKLLTVCFCPMVASNGSMSAADVLR